MTWRGATMKNGSILDKYEVSAERANPWAMLDRWKIAIIISEVPPFDVASFLFLRLCNLS